MRSQSSHIRLIVRGYETVARLHSRWGSITQAAVALRQTSGSEKLARGEHKGDVTLPPMGSRWRLKASVDEAVCRANDNAGKPYPPEMRRLIRALKGYGMILADNGIAIRISTDADSRWGNPESTSSPEYVLNGWTHCLTGHDFEVVDSSLLTVSPDSAEVVQ